MFLADTMIVSELAKSRERRNSGVTQWLAATPSSDVFVSVVTIGEIERGIDDRREADPPFARKLEFWLDELIRLYESRIIPVDVAIARRWGRLSNQIGNKGLDLAIAATALEHGLTIVTRNVSHFAQTGAATIDPFERQ